ncbi:hypothetical protein J2S74_005241 [Evansella vedderi]|uniref:Uncharacterized protein n=1 Tax=Evansella vedderi TaxID=38282 RepID=A0ABU0A2R3_9BACI|nr:hypothetical protein [Evansella vedderi]MDQ0257779.1 hypothetical protein [Evansella vedderi]
MKKINKARIVSVGSILTAIAVIFQSAPVFLPVIGLAFSPFSTLPIALAAFLNRSLGISVYVATAFILTFIYIQEAIILIFTTGLLGITIGTFLYRKGLFVSILFSSLLLSLGMVFLTYFVGIAVFGNLTSTGPIPFTFFIFFSFSLIYASIWNICLRKFIDYLMKIKAFGNAVSF